MIVYQLIHSSPKTGAWRTGKKFLSKDKAEKAFAKSPSAKHIKKIRVLGDEAALLKSVIELMRMVDGPTVSAGFYESELNVLTRLEKRHLVKLHNVAKAKVGYPYPLNITLNHSIAVN